MDKIRTSFVTEDFSIQLQNRRIKIIPVTQTCMLFNLNQRKNRQLSQQLNQQLSQQLNQQLSQQLRQRRLRLLITKHQLLV